MIKQTPRLLMNNLPKWLISTRKYSSIMKWNGIGGWGQRVGQSFHARPYWASLDLRIRHSVIRMLVTEIHQDIQNHSKHVKQERYAEARPQYVIPSPSTSNMHHNLTLCQLSPTKRQSRKRQPATSQALWAAHYQWPLCSLGTSLLDGALPFRWFRGG